MLRRVAELRRLRKVVGLAFEEGHVALDYNYSLDHGADGAGSVGIDGDRSYIEVVGIRDGGLIFHY
jgi:hypothetical protein